MESPPRYLRNLGQSLWLDNITRTLLDDGTLERYVRDLEISGLTSNPTIFNNAITKSTAYDDEIRRQLSQGSHGEALFFALAIQDLSRAADLLLPIYYKTNTVDGYVSLEVSPLFAHDTEATVKQAKDLHKQANKPNLLIKIPGTQEGLPAIEEAIFAGVPINVTLLFSTEHYRAAADAYLRGLERRVKAGMPADIRSVASLFVSRSDVAVADRVPLELRNKLGLAIGRETYRAYREILNSARFQRLENFGARPQRLLFASTGTKDKKAPDTLYVDGLAAPNTINTMPDVTLLAFAAHGGHPTGSSSESGHSEAVIDAHHAAGVDLSELAAKLQADGASGFVKSWTELLTAIKSKGKAVQ